MATVITQSDVAFLKQAYTVSDIDLVNTEDDIEQGSLYVAYEAGFWRVYKMLPERVGLLQARVSTLSAACYVIKGGHKLNWKRK